MKQLNRVRVAESNFGKRSTSRVVLKGNMITECLWVDFLVLFPCENHSTLRSPHSVDLDNIFQILIVSAVAHFADAFYGRPRKCVVGVSFLNKI